MWAWIMLLPALFEPSFETLETGTYTLTAYHTDYFEGSEAFHEEVEVEVSGDNIVLTHADIELNGKVYNRRIKFKEMDMRARVISPREAVGTIAYGFEIQTFVMEKKKSQAILERR
jgi:hypothetical protein